MTWAQSMDTFTRFAQGERDKLRKNGGKLALLERRFRASKKWTQILIATVQRRISEGLIAAETLNKALEESDQRMTRVEQALSDLNRVVNYLLKQPPPITGCISTRYMEDIF